jgi:pSer/pThr/pTyr-binding forkhead associated (FHA) protein
MLKIRFKDNHQNAIWLVEPKITIGRSPTNTVVIDDPLVADIQVEITVNNEHLLLRNLNPQMGIVVNGQRVSGLCELKPGDELSVASHHLIIIDPKKEPKLEKPAPRPSVVPATQLRPPKATGWSIRSNHPSMTNKSFHVQEITLVGRASDCDITLDAAHLSRHHAQLYVIDNMLYVKDLGSSNGTYLNGKKVTESRVKRGDELRFDTLSFAVIGPAGDREQTSIRRPIASAKSLSETSKVRPTPAEASQQSPNNGVYGMGIIGFLLLLIVGVLIFK